MPEGPGTSVPRNIPRSKETQEQDMPNNLNAICIATGYQKKLGIVETDRY